MYWHDMSWWAWLPMTLGMILVWGVVAWAVIRLLMDHRDPVREPREPTAREILDARFARGAIDATEYQDVKRLLEADPSAPGDEHERTITGSAGVSSGTSG